MQGLNKAGCHLERLRDKVAVKGAGRGKSTLEGLLSTRVPPPTDPESRSPGNQGFGGGGKGCKATLLTSGV